MKIFVLAFFFIGLSGCSTVPISPRLAKEVTPTKEFQVKANSTPVTIVRDEGMMSGMCAITVFINGQPLAELETGEKVIAYLPAGEVVVGAGFIGKGICHGAPKKEREFVIKDGISRTLRIFIDQSGNVDILPTTIN